MDGLQCLPPPLLEKLMERKVVLASILAWKMAATGLLPKVVQVGCWGVRVGSDRWVSRTVCWWMVSSEIQGGMCIKTLVNPWDFNYQPQPQLVSLPVPDFWLPSIGLVGPEGFWWMIPSKSDLRISKDGNCWLWKGFKYKGCLHLNCFTKHD